MLLFSKVMRLPYNNSKPEFTDQELVCIWFFGHLNEKFQKKQIHDFILHYWADWFPQLPSYQTFSYRLNLLEQTFQTIGAELFKMLHAGQTPERDHLIDSFPVMLAQNGHAYSAKVAREIANVGYCAAKKTYFHGVRLHTIAMKRFEKLPSPSQIWHGGSLASRPDGCQRTTSSFARHHADCRPCLSRSRV